QRLKQEPNNAIQVSWSITNVEGQVTLAAEKNAAGEAGIKHFIVKVPETPEAIVKRLNLAKTSGDTGAIASAIREAIAENPKAIGDLRGRKGGGFHLPVGAVLKKARGKADPGEL